MSNRQSAKWTATAARPTPPEQTADKSEQADTFDTRRVVAEGETLEEIAERSGVPLQKLQRLNGIKRSELIWPSMTLRTE